METKTEPIYSAASWGVGKVSTLEAGKLGMRVMVYINGTSVMITPEDAKFFAVCLVQMAENITSTLPFPETDSEARDL